MKTKIILIFLFFINTQSEAQKTISITIPKVEHVIIGINSGAEFSSNKTSANVGAATIGIFGEIKILPRLSFNSSVNFAQRKYFIVETNTREITSFTLKTEREILERAFSFDQLFKFTFYKKKEFSYFIGVGMFLKSISKSKIESQRTPDAITGFLSFQGDRRYGHNLVGGIYLIKRE